MLYEPTQIADKIGQGDIFMNIPYIELGFEMSILGEDGKTISVNWQEIIESGQDVAGVLGVTSVPAIVITQKCDAQEKEYITLCEIVKLSELSAFRTLEEKTLNNIAETLVENNRKMPGIFYLPPNDAIGFAQRMAVNFLNTIRLKRKDLEQFKFNRKGRLNKMANEHFREKLSHFFHRYAWNEWYILNKQEIGAHKIYSRLDPTELYDYQRG